MDGNGGKVKFEEAPTQPGEVRAPRIEGPKALEDKEGIISHTPKILESRRTNKVQSLRSLRHRRKGKKKKKWVKKQAQK
jgi:hypothetical protein